MAFRRDKKAVIKEVINLVKAIGGNGIPVKAAYLFGSYAYGKPKRWSDIDLLIVSDKFTGIRFYDVEKLLPLAKGYDNLIEFHPFKASDFNPEDLFIKEVVEKGIRIK